MSKASRFEGALLDDIGDTPIVTKEEAPARAAAKAPKKTAPKRLARNEGERGPGRPPGKRSSDEWTPVTTFIKGTTLQSTEIELIKLGRKRELGNLIETLLNDWLKKPRQFDKY